MQKHDDKYHGGHWEEGQRCEKREAMKKENKGEELAPPSSTEGENKDTDSMLREYDITYNDNRNGHTTKRYKAKSEQEAIKMAEKEKDFHYVDSSKPSDSFAKESDATLMSIIAKEEKVLKEWTEEDPKWMIKEAKSRIERAKKEIAIRKSEGTFKGK